jgi:hypothetical protein
MSWECSDNMHPKGAILENLMNYDSNVQWCTMNVIKNETCQRGETQDNDR